MAAVSISGLQRNIIPRAVRSPFLRLGGSGRCTRSRTPKYVTAKSRLPTTAQNRAMERYLVFSSSVPLIPTAGSTNPRIIKKAIGMAEPTPLAVRPMLIREPRSAGLGVIALGSPQNGTSLAV